MTLKDEIRQLAVSTHDTVVGYRRHLHAHPELSFQERETAAFVKGRLTEMNISWQTMAGTGIVATITGEKESGQVIALRADMDALPIKEANRDDYISRNPGVMHACGHDAHMASLLGVAAILQAVRGRFGGTVKMIFQPGEEKLPGGASLMIQEGVLDNHHLSAVVGQHVSPAVDSGKIAMR